MGFCHEYLYLWHKWDKFARINTNIQILCFYCNQVSYSIIRGSPFVYLFCAIEGYQKIS